MKSSHGSALESECNMSEVYYLDSHCHLFSEEFQEDFDEVIERSRKKGVVFLNIMCTEEEEAYRAMDFSETDRDHISVSYGIFPTDAEDAEKRWSELEKIAEDPRCTCIGEIGLDYYWEKDPAMHDLQKEVFARQIELARKLNKPFCVHSRDAIQDTYDLMKAHHWKGLMHSFSGSAEMGREFVKLGYYLSLGGPVTFKNARHAANVAREMDVNFLLTETDSPYMAPVPVRGKRNEPSYIPHIVKKIAELRQMEEEILAAVLIENWRRFRRLQ